MDHSQFATPVLASENLWKVQSLRRKTTCNCLQPLASPCASCLRNWPLARKFFSYEPDWAATFWPKVLHCKTLCFLAEVLLWVRWHFSAGVHIGRGGWLSSLFGSCPEEVSIQTGPVLYEIWESWNIGTIPLSEWQKVLVFYCFMNQWLLGWLFCWKVSDIQYLIEIAGK